MEFFGKQALACVVAIGACTANLAGASAQDRQAGARGDPAPLVAARSDRYANVRVSELVGMDVRNNAGRIIGNIEEVVIDTRSGEVPYVVLKFEVSMGMTDKLYAYPTSAFAGDLQAGALVLKLPEQRLSESEAFERDRWPSNDTSFWQRLQRVFGGTPELSALQVSGLARGSELVGSQVADRSGECVGRVEDIVLNLGQRQVRFVVLATDRDRLAAVPMGALSPLTSERRTLVLESDRQAVANAPTFNRSRWPDLTQGGLRERYESYWNTAPTPQRGHSAAFESLDRNQDGILSADEYRAAAEESPPDGTSSAGQAGMDAYKAGGAGVGVPVRP